MVSADFERKKKTVNDNVDVNVNETFIYNNNSLVKNSIVKAKCSTYVVPTNNGGTTIWSARIPQEIKVFLREHGFSAGQALVEFARILRGNELGEALKELSRREESVLQMKGLVLHLQSQCNTETQKCNTIFEEFCKTGRNIHQITSQDRFWIKTRLKDASITTVTVDSFIMMYKEMKK